ncbi:MAG: AMP-dependent synthetase/ligase [Solirubrobacteraceae bacterium]
MSSTITPTETLATLLPDAVARNHERIAVRQRAGTRWRDVSYAEVGDTVTALALGLIALDIAPGDRVAILASTRPEWTYADFAISVAGCVVVPIYPTNSPQECEWVLSDSDAVAVVCEDACQLEKVAAIRDRLPGLRTLISIEPAEGAITLEQVIERGRGGDRSELDRRADAVQPDDPYTFIYTSGTTGPPKGCVLSHANFRAVLDIVREHDLLSSREDLTYLFLPLAHALALIMQLSSFEAGGAIAYSGGDPRQLLREMAEVGPTFLPSVPRIFEKVYAAVTRDLSRAALRDAVRVGGAVHELRRHGEPVPNGLRAAYDQLDERLFARVRAAFGGRLRMAVTGAAPVAPEILEFFWACGVPVMEGYGMTETASAISINTYEEHRFGTVGKPLPDVEVRIAGDREILVRGANVFGGYHKDADTTSFGAIDGGWLHTGDLGVLDEDGYLSITGRKKDIIITAGGKNIAPANLENDLKRSPWISHAVMHGDRRPYPVVLITLDDEQTEAWARRRGLPTDALGSLPEVRKLIQAELDRANANYAQVEQAKKFVILERDLSQQSGELTPTLKVKRDVVNAKYAALIDALYA